MLEETAAETALPRPYTLIRAGDVGSAVDQAVRLACGEAEEGTLVWATSSADVDRYGIEDEPRPGNLYCALVLRPDEPVRVAAQLGIVAGISLGHAIAELVSPMTELHFDWPSHILLNHGRAAGISLTAAESHGVPEWVVLGIAVNLQPAADVPHLKRASVCQEGSAEIAAGDLLQQFSRHLLTWLDRWANEGFAPVRRAWLSRAWGLNQAFHRSESGEFNARVIDMDTDGGLVLESPGAERRTLGLAAGFGLED